MYAHRTGIGTFFAPFEYGTLIFGKASSLIRHKGGCLGVILGYD